MRFTVGILTTGLALALAVALAVPASALAGQAATGELFFYPCSSCHPLTPGSVAPSSLPNDFPSHRIVLEAHDVLGKGSAACSACHADATADPGKLKLVDGTLVDITGDIAAVCYPCHSAKYAEWQAGIHGRGQPKCTSAGCHNPHTPSWIYVEPLLPFVGTGIQVRAVSDRQPFTPLAAPPIPAPVETPGWLVLAFIIVTLFAIGVTVYLVRGGTRRTADE